MRAFFCGSAEKKNEPYNKDAIINMPDDILFILKLNRTTVFLFFNYLCSIRMPLHFKIIKKYLYLSRVAFWNPA